MSSFMEDHADTLTANGYHIIPIIPQQKVPGRFSGGQWWPLDKWQGYCTKAANQFEIDAWKRWPDCGVGLACGSVIGIDIDVLTDPDVAFGLERLAREMLGETVAARIGQAPKRALFYRAETPFRGRKKHPLEVYGLGSQMVIHGVHPVTGKPYLWPQESLMELDISQLPVISEAMAMAWLEEAFKRVPANLKPATLAKPEAGPSASNHANDPRGTYEAVKSALEFLPNNDLDGASWVQIMNAIKAALGEEGRDLWLDWSKSSAKSGASGKSDTAERRYKTARPHSIGAGTIYHLAMERGWVCPAGVPMNAEAVERAAAAVHPAQALLDSSKAKHQETTIKLAQAGKRKLPALIMDGLDGFLRTFVDHATTTARSVQPYLAVGAALAGISAAAGRRYKAEDGTRPNVMIVALAASAGGKERPRDLLADLFMEAGMWEYLGGSRIASSAGVLTALRDHPVVLFPMDEIGHVFGINASKQAGAHKSEILPLFTEIFTKSGSTYLGTNMADSKLNPKAVLYQPHIIIYGVTVPGPFWKAFGSAATIDGSLARFLIQETPEDYPDTKVRQNIPNPTELIDGLLRLSGTAQGEGNLSGMRAARMNAATPHEAAIVPFDAEARALFDGMLGEELELKRKFKGKPEGAAWGRLVEHTIKIALNKALGRFATDPDKGPPVITGADAMWAAVFVRDCIGHSLLRQGYKIADNADEALENKIMEFIAGTSLKEATRGEIGNAVRGDARKRNDILRDLVERDRLILQIRKTSDRPSTVYMIPTVH